MKNYDAIIFDLDGTLWDASEASSMGWNAALQSRGMVDCELSREDIRAVSGKPFEVCVATLLSRNPATDDSELIQVLDSYERSFVEAHGGAAYENVLDGIAVLAEHHSLFLVSNCQDWYLASFWKHIPLQCYFKDWDCHGSSRKSKAEMLQDMVQRHRPGKPIYIGDTEGDREASDAAGMDFGYVFWICFLDMFHTDLETLPTLQ